MIYIYFVKEVIDIIGSLAGIIIIITTTFNCGNSYKNRRPKRKYIFGHKRDVAKIINYFHMYKFRSHG